MERKTSRRLGVVVGTALLAVWMFPGATNATHLGSVQVGHFTSGANETTGVGTTVGNGLQGNSTDATASGIYGQSDNGSYGVAGRSTLCNDLSDVCVGVFGDSPGKSGVLGNGPIGVLGDSINYVSGPAGVIGVMGRSTYGKGVYGEGDTHGVHGKTANAAGIGVLAENTAGGPALQVTGKAKFSRSGKAIVPAGTSIVTVPGVALSKGSYVLATMQVRRSNVTILAADPDPNTDSITITLSSNVPLNTGVAWFVLN